LVIKAFVLQESSAIAEIEREKGKKDLLGGEIARAFFTVFALVSRKQTSIRNFILCWQIPGGRTADQASSCHQ
jgi:hypothetical protein